MNSFSRNQGFGRNLEEAPKYPNPAENLEPKYPCPDIHKLAPALSSPRSSLFDSSPSGSSLGNYSPRFGLNSPVHSPNFNESSGFVTPPKHSSQNFNFTPKSPLAQAKKLTSLELFESDPLFHEYMLSKKKNSQTTSPRKSNLGIMAVNLLSVSGGWGEANSNENEIASKLDSVHLKKDEPPEEQRKPGREADGGGGTGTPSSPPAAKGATGGGTEEKTDAGGDEAPLSVAEVSLLAKISRSKLVTTEAEIEVQRKDPFSPLHSVKSFEALHLKPNLLKGVYEMGFNAPSKIQETALPLLLAEPPHNMIAQSQSGTGKTAAFVLAMLSRVDPALNYPQVFKSGKSLKGRIHSPEPLSWVLCLSPTYELAIQTGEVAAKMGKFCEDIRIKYAVRGEDLAKGSKVTEHIVIGTPGKVLDWTLKFRFFDLSKIRVFVLDEADVMIATQGHQDQSYRIRRMLKDNLCQIMFFSATYDDEVINFAQAIVPDPIVIRLKREEESLDNIKQYYVVCENRDEKYNAIANIYGGITIGQVMIFCHTRATASWLCEKMTRDGHAVALLSGELTVEQRIDILDRFREGKEKVLITTNVLARGIDVEMVTIVVNFDLPVTPKGKADCETYLHRIGRTGRFGKRGLAINLVSQRDARTTLKEIEEHFGKKITLLNTEDCDEVEQLNN